MAHKLQGRVLKFTDANKARTVHLSRTKRLKADRAGSFVTTPHLYSTHIELTGEVEP